MRFCCTHSLDWLALAHFSMTADPKFVIYMGKDKFENEELIRWSFPEDIWLAPCASNIRSLTAVGAGSTSMTCRLRTSICASLRA